MLTIKHLPMVKQIATNIKVLAVCEYNATEGSLTGQQDKLQTILYIGCRFSLK